MFWTVFWASFVGVCCATACCGPLAFTLFCRPVRPSSEPPLAAEEDYARQAAERRDAGQDEHYPIDARARWFATNAPSRRL